MTQIISVRQSSSAARIISICPKINRNDGHSSISAESKLFIQIQNCCSSVLLTIILKVVSCALYFLFYQSIDDRAQAWYISKTSLCASICFVAICWKMSDVLQINSSTHGGIEGIVYLVLHSCTEI